MPEDNQDTRIRLEGLARKEQMFSLQKRTGFVKPKAVGNALKLFSSSKILWQYKLSMTAFGIMTFNLLHSAQ
jgi:hypothetical protein